MNREEKLGYEQFNTVLRRI